MLADSSASPLVSIVIATWARRQRLQACIAHVRRNVTLAYELIVVGSGAGDGTDEWVAAQADVRFVRETRREGATRAYNKGLRAAQGRYVMWLNDDAHPLPGAVEAAVVFLEQPAATDVGMVAFYHDWDRERNRLDTCRHDGRTFSIYNIRGYPYANFGLLRRDLLARLDFLDERYYFCAWDPDLALKVQLQAGLKVVGCRRALISHEELLDERKKADLAVAEEDNARLFAKWALPAKDSYPDPGPAYRAMLRARGWLDEGS